MVLFEITEAFHTTVVPDFTMSIIYIYIYLSGDDNDEGGEQAPATPADKKPVCYCNYARSTCNECGKGWMTEINEGRPCKLGHLDYQHNIYWFPCRLFTCSFYVPMCF